MPLDLKKLVGLGRKAIETVEDLQAQQGGPEQTAPSAGARTPGELAEGDTISLYWKDGGSEDDTGWFQTHHDAVGGVVVPEGRVGSYGEASRDEPQIPQELFRDHFGFALVWEQPDPAQPRFLGRRPG